MREESPDSRGVKQKDLFNPNHCFYGRGSVLHYVNKAVVLKPQDQIPSETNTCGFISLAWLPGKELSDLKGFCETWSVIMPMKLPWNIQRSIQRGCLILNLGAFFRSPFPIEICYFNPLEGRFIKGKSYLIFLTYWLQQARTLLRCGIFLTPAVRLYWKGNCAEDCGRIHTHTMFNVYLWGLGKFS